MSRTARQVAPGLPHHIYARGNNRRRLFSSTSDYELFLRCLALGLATSGCVLHQLTLMTNHFHSIVTPPAPAALATFMHRTNQRYAQIRNRKRDGSGKLFEERFNAKVIEDETYLARVTLYNDVNAYRAGKSRDPLAYVWSTGPMHAGVRGSEIPLHLWTPSDWYIGLGKDRAAIYAEMAREYVVPPDFEPLGLGEDTEDPRTYRQRLERPDGSCAAEPRDNWPSDEA